MSEETTFTPDQQQRVTRLLMRLGSRDNADRWTAQTELRKMPPVPIPLLLAFMVHLARIRRQAPFLLFLGLLASAILLLGLLLVFDSLFGRLSHVPVLLAGLTGVVLMLRRWISMRDAATRALANYNDVRAVGPLIEHLAGAQEDRETRKVARELLVHLLPRLQAQNANLLTTLQHQTLLALLDHNDADLTAAAQPYLQAMSAGRTRDRLQGNLLRVIDTSGTETPEPQDRNTQPKDISTQKDTSKEGEDS